VLLRLAGAVTALIVAELAVVPLASAAPVTAPRAVSSVGEPGLPPVYYLPDEPRDVQPLAQVAPLTDTFTLHSKPGSAHTVFLDFGDFGAFDLTGTWWNSSYGVVPQQVHGWSPPGLTTAQRQTAIQQIWATVAEDYAPFDVDVTTEDPGSSALSYSGPDDTRFGTRVLITDDPDTATSPWTAICASSCGGWSGIGTSTYAVPSGTTADGTPYSPDYYDTDLVFANALSDNARYIGDAAAHESGHTFGLTHQGFTANGTTNDYYTGTTLWAPIMGASYTAAVAGWAHGEYPTASNQQDELSTITSFLGLRADEAGDTAATAGSLLDLLTVMGRTGVGVIGPNDADWYALNACTGTATISAKPAPTDPDLDIHLSVVDASGTVVASDDPATTASEVHTPVPNKPAWYTISYQPSGMDASVTTPLTAGPYYVVVRGGGSGAGGADEPVDGFTGYGSVGTYTVSVSGCSESSTAPSAPTALTLTAASGASTASGATLAWDAPVATGGSAVTSYQVSVDGGPWASTERRSATLPTLAAGNHTVAVRAVSDNGPGTPATLSPPATPTLDAKLDPTARAVKATWTIAIGEDGGLPVTYDVAVDDAASYHGNATTRSLPVDHLGPHTVAISASNLLGTSGTDDVVTTAFAPSAPAGITFTVDPQSGSVAVAWREPGDIGQSGLTGYQVTLDHRTPETVTTTSDTFPGLPLGSAHTVSVAAVNGYGPGAPVSTTFRVTTPSPSFQGAVEVHAPLVYSKQHRQWALRSGSTVRVVLPYVRNAADTETAVVWRLGRKQVATGTKVRLLKSWKGRRVTITYTVTWTTDVLYGDATTGTHSISTARRAWIS